MFVAAKLTALDATDLRAEVKTLRKELAQLSGRVGRDRSDAGRRRRALESRGGNSEIPEPRKEAWFDLVCLVQSLCFAWLV